jgi:hypothetical protein
VEPDDRLTSIDEGLREVNGVKGMIVGGVVELIEDGGDLVIGRVWPGHERVGVVVLVEDFEWRWRDCWASRVRRDPGLNGGLRRIRRRGGFATGET